MPELVLKGCAPIPLAAYLKALGVFRLVAEQKDKTARGCWRDETFILDTTLTEDDLVRFFLDGYRPTPMISPWNGGSGFFPKDNKKGITPLISAQAERLTGYRRTIETAKQILCNLGIRAKPEGAAKERLIGALRAGLGDGALPWLDAAVAITSEKLAFPPLLGSGGNDGRLDFTNNFMQRLSDLIDAESGAALAGAKLSLESALLGCVGTSAGKGAVGQFAPGATGGPNATAGFERGTLINPWDYVLMLEGALMFAASVTRRLHDSEAGTLSYPFTVRTTSAAGAGASAPDERDARGEIWLPIWTRPAEFAEIRVLLSEGRATLGRRPARDGLDFVRAVATLGVNRGVDEFQRFGFLQRFGKAYVAAPMTRVVVQRNPKADLLNDLDSAGWLQSFRRLSREGAPARLTSLGRRIDEAIFALTQHATPQAVQQVLTAMGEAAAYLASSPKARAQDAGKQKPPPRLRRDWYDAANDGTPEFRIAAALAGLGRGPDARLAANTGDERGDTADGDDDAQAPDREAERHAAPPPAERMRASAPPPFRAHLAPLEERTWYSRYRWWDETSRLAVWGQGTLDRNLIAVLDRRLLIASQRSFAGSVFDGRAPTDLASALAFLAGTLDDDRIAALAQGLAWAEPPNLIRTATHSRAPLPLAYALMKPFFASPRDLEHIEEFPKGIELPIPPGLVQRLRAGQIGGALALACRRARASGLPVTFEPGVARVDRIGGPRLLASLLIPIRRAGLRRALERAYPALFEEKVESLEERADAA